MTTAITNPLEDKTVTFTAFGSDTEVKLSIAMVRKFLCKPTAKGCVPNDADCMGFMMLCQARALNPWERDAFLVGYDSRDNGPEFSVITAISAFTKRAESSSDFDGLESGVIVKTKDGAIEYREGDFYLDGETIVGGWANVYKKNVRIPYKSRLRLQARYKDTKFWKSDTAGMIVKNAEADALRMAFPTKLGGLYLAGEIGNDSLPQSRDVSKPQTAKERLAALRETTATKEAPEAKETDTVDVTSSVVDVAQTETLREFSQQEDISGDPLLDFTLAVSEETDADQLTALFNQCPSFGNQTSIMKAKDAVNARAKALGLEYDPAMFCFYTPTKKA